MLTEPDDRLFIFSQYVPQMESLKKEAQECKDSEVMTYIEDIIKRACDFDLSGIDNYINKKNRLINYLCKTWNGRSLLLYDGGVEFLAIGACKEDRFYFLMLKLYYNNPFPTMDVHSTWSALIHRIKVGTGAFHRRQEVVDTIDMLALSTADRPLKPADRQLKKAIDWPAWQAFLDKSKPIEMWQLILHPSNYERRQELSTLAFHHKIILFEPYYPITSKKVQQIRDLIKDNILAQKNQVYDDENSYRIVPYSENIESDKRFKRSTKKGIIYEADSIGFISDVHLIALGAKTWTRDKINIIDNIVLISQMAQKEELLQQSPSVDVDSALKVMNECHSKQKAEKDSDTLESLEEVPIAPGGPGWRRLG